MPAETIGRMERTLHRILAGLLILLSSCTAARDQLVATKDGVDGMTRAFVAQSSILHRLVDDPQNGMTAEVRTAYQEAIAQNESMHRQFSQLVLTIVGTYAGIAEWVAKQSGGDR